MNYLGIDYGLKHIGVALAASPLAEPLTTIPREGNLISMLARLIDEHSIGEIVVGIPNDPTDADWLGFIEDIKNLGRPVRMTDETLSSRDARLALMHTTKKKRKELEHSMAAVIILQNWMDSRE